MSMFVVKSIAILIIGLGLNINSFKHPMSHMHVVAASSPSEGCSLYILLVLGLVVLAALVKKNKKKIDTHVMLCAQSNDCKNLISIF